MQQDLGGLDVLGSDGCGELACPMFLNSLHLMEHYRWGAGIHRWAESRK